MFIKKKRVIYIFVLFLLIISLLVNVAYSETAYFAWYDASQTLCKTSTKDAVLEGGATTTASAPCFSEYSGQRT